MIPSFLIRNKQTLKTQNRSQEESPVTTIKRITGCDSNVVLVDTAANVIELAVHLINIWKQDGSVQDA